MGFHRLEVKRVDRGASAEAERSRSRALASCKTSGAHAPRRHWIERASSGTEERWPAWRAMTRMARAPQPSDLSLKARPACSAARPGDGGPAGRVAGAPAAMAARLCFSGALAVTSLAMVDDELWRAPRPRAVLSSKGSGSGATARLGAGLLALQRSEGDIR
jgi:hypothetical protein